MDCQGKACELAKLKSECLACRKCQMGGMQVDGKFLSNVFSNMNASAEIMVVGQNPGRDEVEQGQPFVGRAGKIFDEAVLEVLGFDRSKLYISNTVRCYTPANRKPFDSERENCCEFLDKEVALIQPKVLVALGGLALKQLTGMSGMMKNHGQIIMSARYRVPVIPILHPSPLNLSNPVRRREFFSDLWKLKEVLDGRPTIPPENKMCGE